MPSRLTALYTHAPLPGNPLLVAGQLALNRLFAASVNCVDSLVQVGMLTFTALGALVTVRRRFDLIGILVLASATAIGRSSIRNTMVGTLPQPRPPCRHRCRARHGVRQGP